ncbi:ERCC4 domain-containing protein [Whalleya microplaca]|nr:ERCC4 domain-containing protein [Whalleya microplaca]
MPPPVISLLSSSPSPPSPPAPAPTLSPKPRSRTSFTVPSRALDYDFLDLTDDLPSTAAPKPCLRIPKKPIAGAKRTSSNNRQKDDDDFMFLSDDFDTTGDLDGNATKRRRVSPPAASSKNGEGSSFKRTKSAAAGSLTRELNQSTGLKRWKSMADPIEYSSSPNGFDTTRNLGASYDPFDSPPRQQTTSKRPDIPSMSNMSNDPFGNSPIRGSNAHGTSTKSRAPQLPPRDSFGSPKYPGNKQPPKAEVIDLSDDLFISSPARKISKQKAAWDPISSSMPEARRAPSPIASNDSDSDLPELGDIDIAKIRSKKRSISLSPSLSPVKKQPKAAKRSSKKTTEEIESAKQERAKAREAEKERKRVEKERAKEQRALDRQKEKALAEVNKLRTDKKISTPEMIVDLPSTLNPDLRAHVEPLFDKLDIQYGMCPSRVDNVVRWRRKVASRYNEEGGHWEPTPMHIRDEEHVLVIVQAAEFVALVQGPEGQDLEAHILKIQTGFPATKVIYLIEGLTAWMRKNKNILNRQFASAVRGLDPSTTTPTAGETSSSRRRTKQPQQYIDEDTIEDALLTLQVTHSALIHHTHAPVETAQWLATFTQHMSTIPYRRARDATVAAAGFCMDAGQVRSGDCPADVYVRMLQEISRVTAPAAYGVAAVYPSVVELVRGLERGGPGALEGVRKCADRNGAVTERSIGQAMSRRLWRIFTGREPGCMDV